MPKSKQTAFLRSVNKKLHLSFGGLIGGLIFYSLSFTPSLLPRGYVLQGVAAGLSFAAGYGLAVAIAHFYHELPTKYQLFIPSFVKKIIITLLLLTAIVFIFLGYDWQQQIRKITQATSESGLYPVGVVLVSILISALLIFTGRGILHFGRYCARKLSKWLSPTLAKYLGAVLAAIILIFLVNGVIFKLLFGFINYSFGLKNGSTPTGIYQPQSSIYSGSPTSNIDWNTLGEKGREFVASAPTQNNIQKYSSPDNATAPSRLYVGLESAPKLEERVNLLVKELDRTGANKRKAILIAIPTGSGGVNAKSIESVEYIFNGDTTTMGIQYSYLPSWLSFLADQETARQNGKALVEGVYDWWSHQDPTTRPKLLMYGESLGTLGADGAFSGASDMHSRMNGVLLAGPPNANNLWKNIVSNREPDSREVLPVYQNGEVVRFTDGVTQFSHLPNQPSWADNRVGFIQHASDPVVWASLDLFVHKPDWLKEPRGSDVLPNMRWYPFVTAWQVALDLPFAFGATPGHGHRYGNSVTSGWINVLNVNLNQQKSQQLQQIIDQVKG